MTCHLFYKSEKNHLGRINIVAIMVGLEVLVLGGQVLRHNISTLAHYQAKISIFKLQFNHTFAAQRLFFENTPHGYFLLWKMKIILFCFRSTASAFPWRSAWWTWCREVILASSGWSTATRGTTPSSSSWRGRSRAKTSSTLSQRKAVWRSS